MENARGPWRRGAALVATASGGVVVVASARPQTAGGGCMGVPGAESGGRETDRGGRREGHTERTKERTKPWVTRPLAPGIEEMEASFWHLPRYMVAAGQNSTSRVEEGGQSPDRPTPSGRCTAAHGSACRDSRLPAGALVAEGAGPAGAPPSWMPMLETPIGAWRAASGNPDGAAGGHAQPASVLGGCWMPVLALRWLLGTAERVDDLPTTQQDRNHGALRAAAAAAARRAARRPADRDEEPRTTAIDTVSTLELCRILQREDARVPSAVEPCVPAIAEAIDLLTERVRRGGRVFYIGAGTSGGPGYRTCKRAPADTTITPPRRLGVLDASEIPPTYSAPPDKFIALIAGGDYALRNAKEGAEDSRSGAEEDLRPYGFDPDVDSLIGIASSGRTPYVLGGLEHVRRIGGATVAVVCVQPSAVQDEGNADHVIAAVTGPESVTGSTRMKAGTATKLVLNMISTGIMIKLGKTYGNLMIDLKATNIKLRQRAKNILRLIGGAACTQTDDELDAVLAACRGSVKLAAVTIVLGVSVADAEARLERNKGVLARVFEEAQQQAVKEEHHDDGLVLCVDAGGSSCRAVIMTPDGASACGSAGPCNVSTIGVDAAMAVMSTAIQEAADNCEATRGRQFQAVKFSAAWVGMAGYERPALSPLIDAALADLLKLRVGQGLRVTADIDLLPTTVAEDQSLDAAVVLVAGTGSVAMSYARAKDGGFARSARAGGWGTCSATTAAATASDGRPSGGRCARRTCTACAARAAPRPPTTQHSHRSPAPCWSTSEAAPGMPAAGPAQHGADARPADERRGRRAGRNEAHRIGGAGGARRGAHAGRRRRRGAGHRRGRHGEPGGAGGGAGGDAGAGHAAVRAGAGGRADAGRRVQGPAGGRAGQQVAVCARRDGAAAGRRRGAVPAAGAAAGAQLTRCTGTHCTRTLPGR
ncbi:hypothetical protein ACCO45_013779 [Purpureocillium lilacinum]|uniref:Uncharacterized protein n=1 Tax=Purpureocillium lilacinum TaxID=33203 RepID=A0ACC4D7I7_PURLI